LSRAFRSALGYGPQNFWLALPPPVDRQVNVAFAHVWQKVEASVGAAGGMSAAAQLTKQYSWPLDSNEAQTSFTPPEHSPATAQQSAFVLQVWVQ
jgi:hypothetical protein